MKSIRSSITIKLLVLILPLVCIPIMIVGYFSYHSSIKTVSRLSRGEQMLQARVYAGTINSIFKSCMADLEAISNFITDYYQFEVKEKAGTHGKTVIKLFEDFIVHSPYYFEIRLTDPGGSEILNLRSEKSGKQPSYYKNMNTFRHPENQSLFSHKDMNVFRNSGEREKNTIYISKIYKSELWGGYFIDLSKPLKNRSGKTLGKVTITIDYNMVIDLITSVRFGKQGYAFLVDQVGRTIAHPAYEPYQYDFTKYKDARLREFVVNMIIGETGWKTFDLGGEKAAAYAPIEATRWSLAVSIPIEEFVDEANKLKTGVIQTVLIALFLSGFAVAFISHRLLKPIKQLAEATEDISAGNWSKEIPVNSNDELGMLTSSFNRMTHSLRDTQQKLVASEKLISIGRLSAGVAHEFRNPLNAMKGAVNYMKKHRSEDTLITEYSDLLLEEINRLSGFVDEFLYFAKQSKPKPVLIDLNDLIENTLSLFEEEFKNKNIRITRSLEPDLPPMMLDARQIEQVLINLLLNAVDAAGEGGQVHVIARIKDENKKHNASPRVLIIVEDNGKGIQPDDLKYIFDPFFSTKDSGTGLGLPISYGIVEGHGGTIEVDSKPGIGTSMTVNLPLKDKQDQGDAS